MQPTSVGRYEIVTEIGRGGMATVYRAFDPLTKRDVALKVLPREFLHNQTFRTLFDQEARTIAGLGHPVIVPVYDYGEDQDQPFLVMQLMTGGSLAEQIKHGALSIAEASRITKHIALGLDYAHEAGVVHRDLKPANILFDDFDNPHISDFGLATLVAETERHNITSSGIICTPAYAAPEFANNSKSITRLVDIYALGVMLYEMITGQQPYEGDTPVGILIAHIAQPVPSARKIIPSLPEDFQQIIDRAMAKNPKDRYQAGADIAMALQNIGKSNSEGEIFTIVKARRLLEDRKTELSRGEYDQADIGLRQFEKILEDYHNDEISARAMYPWLNLIYNVEPALARRLVESIIGNSGVSVSDKATYLLKEKLKEWSSKNLGLFRRLVRRLI